MRMFITSKNKYLSNDMKIFETCSIPLSNCTVCGPLVEHLYDAQRSPAHCDIITQLKKCLICKLFVNVHDLALCTMKMCGCLYPTRLMYPVSI